MEAQRGATSALVPGSHSKSLAGVGLESASCLPTSHSSAFPTGELASRAAEEGTVIILAAEREARVGKHSLTHERGPGLKEQCPPLSTLGPHCPLQPQSLGEGLCKGAGETREGKGPVQSYTVTVEDSNFRPWSGAVGLHWTAHLAETGVGGSHLWSLCCGLCLRYFL